MLIRCRPGADCSGIGPSRFPMRIGLLAGCVPGFEKRWSHWALGRTASETEAGLGISSEHPAGHVRVTLRRCGDGTRGDDAASLANGGLSFTGEVTRLPAADGEYIFSRRALLPVTCRREVQADMTALSEI